MPLKHAELKGKVDLMWYGFAGWKIMFKDANDKNRVLYIDIFSDNKDCREEEKANPPNDADLVMVSNGMP